ncbi:hypothetical protein [Chitinophaga niabensis]|uniref:Cytochrome C and Quinol oxidase polypeptide I n=1 Tax=Chitinophaga niabensis TaxID=536979 RepID=A0A1N6JQ63_9BACT|nr:hypothetical protein [Chitinophaga niabensis]SIO46534.1 hypothetical protein SAMN04488055_4272 [Chitinophaga niabensis]
MTFLSQPKYILLIISLLVIISGFLAGRSTTDIPLMDTYYIISNFHIGVLMGGFFLLETVLYFLTDNYRQWRSTQWFHVAGTGFSALVAVVLKQTPVFLLAIFLLGQILFIINLIAGFIRGKKVLNHIP